MMFALTVIITILLAYLFFKGALNIKHASGEAAVVMVLGGAVGNLARRTVYCPVVPSETEALAAPA